MKSTSLRTQRNQGNQDKGIAMKITLEEFEELHESNVGICLSCGYRELSGIEPDAHEYTCPNCEEPNVYGMDEALLQGLVTVVDNEEDLDEEEDFDEDEENEEDEEPDDEEYRVKQFGR